MKNFENNFTRQQDPCQVDASDASAALIHDCCLNQQISKLLRVSEAYFFQYPCETLAVAQVIHSN
jgi:hypothetical protein